MMLLNRCLMHKLSQVDQAAQDPNANIQEIAAQREAICKSIMIG